MISIWVLLTFVMGFAIAQLSKLIIAAVKTKGKLTVGEAAEWLTRSGGMPSGHSASFVGATTIIGCLEGFDSAIFALAVCMSVIIIYDATHVRYAVGEQGKVLNKFILSNKKKLKIVEGHTLPEVTIGTLLGVLCALIVYSFLPH